MSRIGTLMICAATLALGLGCDDGRSGEDGGGIILMDSGPDTTPDTGTPPGPTDSGVSSGTCEADSMGNLSAGCFPRCSNPTLGAVNSCGMQAMEMMWTAEQYNTCLDGALGGDMTPSTTLGGDPFDCSGCYNYQTVLCYARTCPAEFNTFAMCRNAGGECMAEQMALVDCLNMNSMAVNGCINSEVVRCFDTSSGFLPDFEPRFHAPPFLLSFEQFDMEWRF